MCRKCQENKLVRIKNRQTMRITDSPTQPFEKIQTDIVGPLPETESGTKYIPTIQENFSKYSDAIPLPLVKSIAVSIRQLSNCKLYICDPALPGSYLEYGSRN